MTDFVAPPPRPEPAPPADGTFGRCMCGAKIYDHARHNKDGNQIWAGCAATGCDKYRASDGSSWPNDYSGATLEDPQDLDLDTVHWIGGRVYLSTDEPPL